MHRLLPEFVLASALFASSTALAQGFTPGDAFLASPAATGISSGQGGIVRIDLANGTTSLFAGPFGLPSHDDIVAYDPHRDRLVFSAQAPNPAVDPVRLWTLDAAGVMTPIGFDHVTFAALAPTGDGRIYLRQVAQPGGRVRYLDAANRLHDLLDASGTRPFTFVPGAFLGYRHMIYHAPTNALIVAAPSNEAQCAGGGTSNEVTVYRAPLAADGTRVVGPVTCNSFDVSPSFEKPVGLGRMPDGDLLLVVDTNSGATEPRMIRVDPFTLAMAPFARNGHAFAAATNAGCFSTALDRAVILDTGGDVLRTFAAGQTGSGTIIPPNPQPVSRGGSNETATMIEINRAPCAGRVEPYGTGLAGSGGFVPTTAVTGCPRAGGTIVLHVASGLGGANGALVVGTAPASTPLFGGTLLVSITASAPFAVGGTPGVPGHGHAAFPLTLVPPLVPDYYLQAVLIDAGAPQGLSMTNGLRLSP